MPAIRSVPGPFRNDTFAVSPSFRPVAAAVSLSTSAVPSERSANEPWAIVTLNTLSNLVGSTPSTG